jgi:hypothetical protein
MAWNSWQSSCLSIPENICCCLFIV